MSVRLEPDAIYLLPDALPNRAYVILQAIEKEDGWQLVECHKVPFGSERFKEREALPEDEMLQYRVDHSGALVQDAANGTVKQTNFTLANLSLLGYIRADTFFPADEGL